MFISYKMKRFKTMKKINLFLILSLLSSISFSQTKNFLDKPYIETVATYTQEVIPDQISMSIIISEKDSKGKVPIEKLENTMINKLNTIGIDTKKQLTISQLGSNFQNYFLKKKDILKRKSFLLIVHDAKIAGKVITALETLNISNVRLTKTAYSKLEELKIELKAKAILKAKKQATVMANALGQKVGKAIYISDINTMATLNGRVSGFNVRGLNSINSAAEIDGIEFEKIKVESTVSINFEIE